MNTFISFRNLTISSLYVRNLWKKPTLKPKLTISGAWMKKAGFEIGEKVTVSVSKNVLIITKAEI